MYLIFYTPILECMCKLLPHVPVCSWWEWPPVWSSAAVPICFRVSLASHIQRCSSAYLSCNEWLFQLLLPSYQLKALSMTSAINKAFFPWNCCSLYIFLFLDNSLVNRRDDVWGNPSWAAVLKCSDQPGWHRESRHIHLQPLKSPI